MVVHLAIPRFAKENLPAYERDDDSLKKADIDFVREKAKPMIPKGKVLTTRSLEAAIKAAK